jgi:hypothetical protein
VRQLDAATARAQELAAGDERPNVSTSGSKLRLVAVPVLGQTLLDAVAREDSDLVDRLATHARSAGLVTNAMGLQHGGVERDETIKLVFKSERGWPAPGRKRISVSNHPLRFGVWDPRAEVLAGLPYDDWATVVLGFGSPSKSTVSTGTVITRNSV